jgi:hypothetical protein
MNARNASLVATFAAALALAPAIAAAQAHSHPGHAEAPAKLTLNQGKKWQTDEALRKGMSDIRALVEPKIAAIHAGKVTAEDYKALGLQVEQKVGDIVAQCKLPADADAMLHLVVAELMAGADTMQGKGAGKPADGAHKIVVAANNYGRYFDHPGWKPLG